MLPALLMVTNAQTTQTIVLQQQVVILRSVLCAKKEIAQPLKFAMLPKVQLRLVHANQQFVILKTLVLSCKPVH